MTEQYDIDYLLQDMQNNGFCIARGLINQNRIDAYTSHHDSASASWMHPLEIRKQSGWDFPTDIHKRDRVLWDFIMQEKLEEIISTLLIAREKMLVHELRRVVPHLSLVYWIAKGQGWHLDEISESMFGIESPPFELKQIGVWVALGEINEESGPFGFVPGSHKYDYRSDEKFHEFRDRYQLGEYGPIQIDYDPSGKPVFGDGNQIAHETEKFKHIFGDLFDKFITQMISSGQMQPSMFTAQPGDVLFWDGRLIHCAHKTSPGNLRKSVIAHYHLSDNPAHLPPWV